MVPAYRADLCNHIYLLWGDPNWVYIHASRRCLQLGKVMGGLYPDQVDGHKPCEPEFGYVHMSLFGTIYCFATTVAVGVCGRHGATHDLAQIIFFMGNRSFLSGHRWSTRIVVRVHGFRGVGTTY